MAARRTHPRLRVRGIRLLGERGGRGQGAFRGRGDRGRAFVRGRTVTCGFGLAGVLLLATALLGGVGDEPDRPEAPGPGHVGPLTAVQPELRDALLTADDLPAAAPRATPVGAAAPPSPAAPPAPLPPAPEETGLTGLCRALLEDPTGLPGLPGLWRATPPQETHFRHTPRPGGAVLHQALSVFESGQAPRAYDQLREAATGCDRFTATLADDTPVTVLLRELGGGGDRRESTTADQGYAMAVTIEGAPEALAGWLSLDRVGSVISVLRHLAPVPPRQPGAGPAIPAPGESARPPGQAAGRPGAAAGTPEAAAGTPGAAAGTPGAARPVPRDGVAGELAETRRAALRLLLPWAGRG